VPGQRANCIHSSAISTYKPAIPAHFTAMEGGV
jgi:hypothetical protein